MKLLCRLCAADNKHLMRNIFDEDGITRNISFRIQSILKIQVSNDDPLPKNICILCLGKLEKCHKFISDCQAAQNLLQKLLQNQIDQENYNTLINEDGKLNAQTSDKNETNIKDSSTLLKQNHKMIILVPKLQLNCVSSNQTISEISDKRPVNLNASLNEHDRVTNQLSVGSAKSFTEPHNPIGDGTIENVSNCISFEQDSKSEIKLDDLLTNPSLDIPFDPLDVPAAEGICDKKCSPLTNITNADTCNHGCSARKMLSSCTCSGNKCFIENATSKMTDPGSTALQNSNCLENGCCNFRISLPKISNCDRILAQKEYRTVSVTFDIQQLENVFKNGTIDEAQLQTLGEEIFLKNARKIIENDCLKLNYKDVQSQNENECTGEACCLPKAIKTRKLFKKPEVVTISDDEDTNILAKVNDSLTEKTDELMELKDELKVECINSSDEGRNEQANANETRAINDPVNVTNNPSELLAGNRNISAALEKPKRLTVLLHPLSENNSVKNFPCHRTKEKLDHERAPTDSEKRGTHSCNICGANFTRKVNLKKHFCGKSERDGYKSSSSNRSSPETRAESVICSVCGKRWRTKGGLIRHIKSEHADVLTVKCPHCPKTFAGRFQLTRHLKDHPNDQQLYVCHTCEQRFKKRRDLNSHVTRKHAEKKVKCPLCSYTTVRKYLLNQHNREVHDKRFVCDICGKRLGKKSKLTFHILSEHTNRSPVKCEYCDTFFTQKFQHRVHLQQVHSKNKRWLCSACECDFAKKFQLRVHISRCHDAKTVECDLCSFTSTHKYRLKQHVREVHEKRFTCGTCGKRESKKSRLKVHIRNKHTTKKSYRCRVCDMEYRLKYRYDEHMEKHS